MSKKKMRHEKHIIQRTNKGVTSFQINIRYTDRRTGDKCVFNQTVSGKDFESVADAFEAAKAVRDKTLTDIRNSLIVLNAPTVDMLFERTFELFPGSVKTVKEHRRNYKLAIADQGLGSIKITELTAGQIQAANAKYIETHTQGCFKRVLSIWRSIYRAAQMDGINVTDKTLMLRPLKSKVPTRTNDVSLRDDEVEQILNALFAKRSKTELSDYRTHLAWYLLKIQFYTGARPSEVLALSEDDFLDLDGQNPRIHICKRVGSTETEECVIIPPKTQSSYRYIPINHECAKVIKRMLEWSPHSAPVLADMDGKPISVYKLGYLIQTTAKKAGIPFNSYRLRHLLATDLLNEKTNPRIVQDIMGHASLAMTLYYARSSEDDRREAIKDRSLS